MALTRPTLQNINTNLTTFSDSLVVINFANIANRDIGTVYDRSQGSVSNVAIVWQESREAFAFAYTTSTGLAVGNIAVTSNANIVAGNISGITLLSTGNTTTEGLRVNSTATIGSTLGVTGNINGSGITLTGSLRATGPGDFDGGLQSTPIGNAAPSTALFTTVGSSGNTTVSALTVNATATIGTTLGVTGNVNIGNVAGVTWANTSGVRAWTYYNNSTTSLDTVFL